MNKLMKKVKRVSLILLFAAIVTAGAAGVTAGLTGHLVVHARENAEAVTEGGTAVIDLADGTYEIAVSLAGGSGKASIESPTEMLVQSGKAYARIAFSSPNYDYMLVDGVTYFPDTTGGNSVFHIPIKCFDSGMEVVADTTAMSTPHEITYTLYFDSVSIRGNAEDNSSVMDDGADAVWGAVGYLVGVCLGIIVMIVGIVVIILVLRRKKKP